MTKAYGESKKPDILIVVRGGVVVAVKVKKRLEYAQVEILDYDDDSFPEDLTEEELDNYDPFAEIQDREDELSSGMVEIA